MVFVPSYKKIGTAIVSSNVSANDSLELSNYSYVRLHSFLISPQ